MLIGAKDHLYIRHRRYRRLIRCHAKCIFIDLGVFEFNRKLLTTLFEVAMRYLRLGLGIDFDRRYLVIVDDKCQIIAQIPRQLERVCTFRIANEPQIFAQTVLNRARELLFGNAQCEIGNFAFDR